MTISVQKYIFYHKVLLMLITIKYIRDYYSLSRISLINWEKQGLLKPYYTPGGRRRYKREDIEHLLGIKKESPVKPAVVCYARVSTAKQKDYLDNQMQRLKSYCKAKGYRDYHIISEIASGVNENRRELRTLLNMAKRGEVSKVVIEYEDRLARFGYEYLKAYFNSFGIDIEVINGNEHEDAQKELAEDLIAMVTSFAARIYGKRGGRKIKHEQKN